MGGDRILSAREMLVLLAIQRRTRDAYGVTIRDEIETSSGQKIPFGVLYTVLHRLEREGLLTSKDGEATPERGGRAKKYFSLSGKGQRALRHTLRSVDRMRDFAHGTPVTSAV
jgi:PadR family transcriptional regulator PadR